MNLWECEHPGCKSTAVGVGGAVGLLAIGWYFRRGIPSKLFCPIHRPDEIPCVELGEHLGKPCPTCAAEKVACALQAMAVDLGGMLEAVATEREGRN